MEELLYVLTQYFVSSVHARFYFSLPLIFTLLAASISLFLTASLNFHVFFLRNSSPLFSITRSSSFSVIYVSVNIKNSAEKDTTMLLYGWPCDFLPIKPWVAFGLPYLFIELFHIGMPVVWTVARSMYGHVITKFSGMGRLPHFLSCGAPSTSGASRHAWSSAKNSSAYHVYAHQHEKQITC